VPAPGPAAGADAIVTGDRAMLALGAYAGVRMLRLADYRVMD